MEGGENIKVQQGAGMAVTKSDEEHEYAASVFLKWFTQKNQNLRFVCESSYMPVLKEANSVDALDSVIKENNIEVNQKVYDVLQRKWKTLIKQVSIQLEPLTIATVPVRSWIILWLIRQRLIKMPWTLQSQTERAGKRLLHSI